MVETFPDLRFSQILANFGFVRDDTVYNPNGSISHKAWVDEYNVEPEVVAQRINTAMEALTAEYEKLETAQVKFEGNKYEG